ncbi:Gfo/Idh/MocA family protein [Pseudonocardia sp. HH130630-07]|uniref:Gfo/Idh/MocA family protein n=1 Tax=Pseudonocardia sp. HH130630-07 TaxID=1690815 RepID=UPI000814BF9A|nr:Gfo/Idh/MocA family oxidoreductase [Pseudonocardia sp. HH130630-07]ANY10593.1 putative oxidoreductase [Pseudonocardia sp. HH130630-07]
MTRPLRLGALGCSEIADRKALPAATSLGEIELVAVASRTRQRAAEFAERHGGRPTGYQELIDAPDVDAVYVSTPAALHHRWTAAALRAGKHVLCEKPLTDNLPDTEELAELAEARDLVLRENFAFLHHPQHTVVADLLRAGRLGSLRTFAATFGIPELPADDIRHSPELGGGALLDVGVYPVRAAQQLLEGPLTVVAATSQVDDRFGVDVSGHVLLHSADGVVADLDFGFRHRYRNRYRLWTSTASLEIDRFFTPPPDHRSLLRIEEQHTTDTVVVEPCDQFRESLRSFAHAATAGPDHRDERAWTAAARETARLLQEIRRVAVRLPGPTRSTVA